VQEQQEPQGSPASVDESSSPRAPGQAQQPVRVFTSYAHADEELRKELHGHLAPLRAQGLIVDWHDRQIRPGMDWDREVTTRIDSAEVILFLVSSKFMSSTYIQSVEYRRALERARAGQACLIPVLLRQTYLQGTELGRLQALPRDLEPVESFPQRDSAWVQVVEAVATEARRRRGQAAEGWAEEAGVGAAEEAALPVAGGANGAAPAPEQWRAFAGRVLSRLQLLDSDTDWSDDLFVEVAAEVEADVDCGKGRRAVKHVPSLERAMQDYPEKIVLVEGEPGSGKSVSLRRLARALATRASAKSEEPHPLLPLYVDLRALEEPLARGEGAQTLRRFIVRQVGAASPQDQGFIQRWFDWGLERGLWLLLLDSFDEIPAVLSSSEPDEPVRRHAEALHDFAGSMHRSRVIVASRAYRGPGRMPWPSFRILPLGEDQRRKIVGAWFSEADGERILAELTSIPSLASCLRNPMLLNLICAHRAAKTAPPASPHQAFESFVERRMESRADLLAPAGLTAARLRAVLERMAFCLTADPEVGLAVSLPVLERVLAAQGMTPEAPLAAAVDCARGLRLARGTGHATAFSFAHRRIQEYFATCFVLEGAQVPVEKLLTDERWRETVVTVFETGDPARLGPIVAAASELLAGHLRALETAVPELVAAGGAEPRDGRAIAALRGQRAPASFPWPPGLLHLLGVLTHLPSASSREAADVQAFAALRALADRILVAVVTGGLRLDCAWALELSAAGSSGGRIALLTWAFASGSEWLEDTAFEQTGSLGEAPPELMTGIRAAIVSRELSGDLQREPTRVEAKIKRLDHSGELLLVARRLRHLRKLDVGCLALTIVVFALMSPTTPGWHGHLLALFSGAAAAAIAYWWARVGMRGWLQWARLGRSMLERKRGRLTSWLPSMAGSQEAGLLMMLFSVTYVRVGVFFLLTGSVASEVASSNVLGRPHFMVDMERGQGATAVLAVVAVLALCFRPGAYLVALLGGWTSRLAYPFVALAPLSLLLRRRVLRQLAYFIAAMIIFGAAFAAAVLGLDEGLNRVCAHLGLDASSVGEALPLLLGAGLAGLTALALIVFLRDRVLSARLHKTRRFDVEQLLRAVDSFWTPDGRTRFVRWVREQGRLHPSPQAQRVLMDAITTVERDNRSRREAYLARTKFVPEPDPRWSPAFGDWYRARLLRGRDGLAAWHGEILDELSRIAVQLRLRVA
jgi:hypothetical protein